MTVDVRAPAKLTTRNQRFDWSRAIATPRSVAVIGASDNPDKVGGRPIQYMQRFGYGGRIFPINPSRREIQGLPSFPRLADAPECPDLAIVAVPAAAAHGAVQACAAAGVSAVVVLTSGFSETGPEGGALQDEMATSARAAGMRLIGPNTQGIANFSSGTIASFATLFGEIEAGDGPVAIVSQSGAMSVVPYAHLRRRGIGVRYAHATGNEADVTVADLAGSVLDDPDTKLLLLYLETIKDPGVLEAVAMRAHRQNVPVLAVKAGRSERGAVTAQSHTGALASEDRVVDAFLRRIGILRVDNMHSLTDAAELFLAAKRPTGRRMLMMSNSGASCVMAADLAEQYGLDLCPLPEATRRKLATALPAFATAQNPLDLTGALLSNSALFGAALDAVAEGATWDQLLIALPNAGAGYDLAGFADATAAFTERNGTVAAVSTPNPSAADVFRARGLATFDHDSHAVAAMGLLACWGALHAAFASVPTAGNKLPAEMPDALASPTAGQAYASEWTSLRALAACGFPVPRMELCQAGAQARAAAARIGGAVVAKASSAAVPHKSEHGLVRLGLVGADAAGEAAVDLLRTLDALRVARDGIIVAEMVRADIELILGARRVPKFGVVVTVGAGGTFVEALKDAAILSAPFTAEAARQALSSLRIAPLFAPLRGRPAVDTEAIVGMMMRLAAVMEVAHARVNSIDLNPVMVARGGSPIVADALIEYA